ncbi:MAG TPA: 4-hydroxy-tetrahydrodipicolinate reductase [Legionellaceae bacterium]|nr:4-hydroxy-tetrahydrodipicolinate reductase [Legionellaceae bacterium]
MTKTVIVNGASGKMGHLACQTIADHPDFELIAALGRHDNLGDTIRKTKAQIVIDLTRADCVYTNALTIIHHHAHPVIGTSGLTEEQIQDLRQQCQQQQWGGIIVPNFSLGAILMMHFAATAARFLTDVEIVETHHPQKIDAPSGTAIKTADMIAKTRVHAKPKLENKISLPGARGANCHEIPIHSLRLPGVLAKQSVIFGNTGETLTITHESIDRSSFMPGLILACQRVSELNTLYYGLDQLIEF